MCSPSATAVSILEPSFRTKFPVKVSTCGPMVKHTQVSGSKIKCMEKVFYNGKMARAMMVSSLMISVKVTESSHGRMAVFTKVSGMKENNMVKVHSLKLMVQSVQVSGRTAATSSGLTIDNIIVL